MKLFPLSLILILSLSSAQADTVYLKNGKYLEGIVKRQKKGNVEIAVNGGTVIFDMREVESIEKSSVEENTALKADWEKQKTLLESKKKEYQQQNRESAEKWEALVTEQIRAGSEKRSLEESAVAIPVTSFNGHVVVSALLNGKVPVQLIIDTGCPTVLLTANVAKKLGIDTAKATDIHEVMVLNGKHKVASQVLSSIRMQKLDEKNVDAEFLLEDDAEMKQQTFKDGLLGMSFLDRFNMTVDQKTMKLILKKHK